MSIQLQTPTSSISNLNDSNSHSNSNSISSQHDSNYPSPATETEQALTMTNSNLHRRAFSDDFYRILDDDMDFSVDPFADSSTPSLEGVSGSTVGGGGGMGWEEEKRVGARHRNSNSADGSSVTGQGVFCDIKESKKAIPPHQLAQLWALDPKRAKRILANRQSAARSKERKARYISELERKVQKVQEEAASHSVQLTLFKRETVALASENTKLKLQLQAMDQQAKMRDAMNEALMQEVERLKIGAAAIATQSDSMNAGMSVTYRQSPAPSTFIPLPQQPLTSQSQMKPLHDDQPSVSPFYLHPDISQHIDFSEDDSLGCLQGFDISNIGSNLLEIEG